MASKSCGCKMLRAASMSRRATRRALRGRWWRGAQRKPADRKPSFMSKMAERFFAPGSAIWRVDREMALLLGGGRALLMQIAHPKIAAGVADHSRFANDPLGRLKQTMETMWSI